MFLLKSHWNPSKGIFSSRKRKGMDWEERIIYNNINKRLAFFLPQFKHIL